MTLTDISEKLIRVLPPAFLLLLILNVLFMGSVLWIVDHNAEQRNVMLNKIIDQCLMQQRMQ